MPPATPVSGPGFTALVPKSWFTDLAHSSVWIRIYNSLNIPHSKFNEVISRFARFDSDTPFLRLGERFSFGVVQIHKLKIPVFTLDTYAQENGQTLAKFDAVAERELPVTNRIFLAMPHTIDGVPGVEGETINRLSVASAIICMHAGLNLMRQCVFDGEVHAGNGNYSITSPILKRPFPVEGPYAGKEVGDQIRTYLKNTSGPLSMM